MSASKRLIVFSCVNFETFSMEDSLASMIHNYKHGFSGFAAMLTEDQAEQLAGKAALSAFLLKQR